MKLFLIVFACLLALSGCQTKPTPPDQNRKVVAVRVGAFPLKNSSCELHEVMLTDPGSGNWYGVSYIVTCNPPISGKVTP